MSKVAPKKFMKCKLDGTVNENLVRVCDAMHFMARKVDNPALYTQKVEFKGDSIYVTWDRAPDELHADLIRIWEKDL